MSIPKHIDRALLLAFLLIASMYSPISLAREWYAKPSASLRGFYDDNLMMLRSDQGQFGVFGGTFSAGSKFGMRTEASDVGVTAQAIINRYSQTQIDNENYHFNFDSVSNVTERHQFALKGRYFLDNNIDQLFTEAELAQILVGRTNWSVEPSWTFRLTETESLIASYSHEEVEFEEIDLPWLNSYRTDMASLNYTNQWTERFQWFALASYLRFETPERPLTNRVLIGGIFPGEQVFTSSSISEMYSIETGFNYVHSETWTSNFMIGGRWTDSESFQQITTRPDRADLNFLFLSDESTLQTDSSPGYLLSVGTNKQFERSSIGASFFQDVRPTAQGLLMQFTGITLTGDNQLTEHLKFSLNASATQQTTAGGDGEATQFDSDFISLEPSLSWQVNRQTTLAGGYRYRWQVFGFDALQARESNSVYLQLNYNWDPFTTSRY